jgi:hypothetical protein
MLRRRLDYYYGSGITPPATYDTDAQAFFDRVGDAGGSLTILEKVAVNNLVLDLKTAGVWSKRKVLYPYVGASAAACAQNLASSSFTGGFSSGFVFAASGISGTTAYMSTGFNPFVEGLAYNDNSIGIYTRYSNQNTAQYECGCGNNTGSALFSLCARRSGNTSIYDSANFPNNRVSASNSNSSGFFLGKANSSTAKFYRNGVSLGTKALTAHSMPNYELYAYSFNEQGTVTYYTNQESSMFWCGLGLTDTEAVDLSTAVATFQAALGR